QTGHVEDFALALLTNQVNHLIDGQTANQLAPLVHHRRGHQVITLEGLSCLVGILIGMESDRIIGHNLGHLLLRVINQQALDGQNTLEHAVVIHYEQLVGMTRQLLESAQITQDHLQAHILADRDHFEVHQGTDLILLIGQGRTDALTLLRIKGLHQLVDDVAGQLCSQVGQLVGIEILGGSQDFVIIHVGDQRLAYRIGNFEQDVTVALGLDQLPDGQAVIQRQRFKDVCNVCRVQRFQLALQLDEILTMLQVVDQLLRLTDTLAVGKILNDLLTMQQFDNLRQTILETFLRLFCFYFSHGALHPRRTERARGSIIQNVIGQQKSCTTTGQIHERDPKARMGGPRNNNTAAAASKHEIQAIQVVARHQMTSSTLCHPVDAFTLREDTPAVHVIIG